MRMEKTRRVNRRNKLFGALFVISLVFIMISVSFSWFTTGKQASVSGIQMQVEDGDELTLKIGNQQNTTMTFEFDADYPLQARTGNGLYFYDAVLGYPEVGDSEDGGSTTLDKVVMGYMSVVDPDAFGELDPGQSECELYIKNGVCAVDFSLNLDKDANAYLYGKSSSDVPSTIQPANKADYENANNKSPYGDFDIGYICGAMRIAILQKNDEGEYAPTLIWAPCSTVELYEDDQGKLHVDPNSTSVEEVYTYVGEDTNAPVHISTDGASSGSVTVDGVVYAWGEIASKLPIGDLIGGQDNDFRLVIWIDGNDRECHNALLSGLVHLVLHFGL